MRLSDLRQPERLYQGQIMPDQSGGLLRWGVIKAFDMVPITALSFKWRDTDLKAGLVGG